MYATEQQDNDNHSCCQASQLYLLGTFQRETLAMRAARPIQRFLLCTLFITIGWAVSATAAQENQTITERLVALGGQPCPDSEFTCVTLAVPLDHFNPTDDRTIEVTFGLLPAKGDSKGLFVTATGGPGTSGLAVADSYTALFDTAIHDNFDIVFFDQRGSILSGDFQCQNAAASYYQTTMQPDTAEGEQSLIREARRFVQHCITEMGVDAERLTHYGTTQAVEDLEMFRRALGGPAIWLYGESYGTQYAQTYAANHPDSLNGLILDGPVDLTRTGTEYLTEQALAFNETLKMTLERCAEQPACVSDFEGNDPTVFYFDLAEELRTASTTIDFPISTGTALRLFTLADLEYAASSYLYGERDRMMLQRALAAAVQGNYTGLARMAYTALSLDSETLELIPDPTFSDGLFYTVECSDYAYFTGTPEERANAYIRAGDQIDNQMSAFSAIFYGDLPCVFWPAKPVQERPAPLQAPNIPTLVLGATADPATPIANGKRILQHLDIGRLIVTDGGPHVVFGRGNECPDSIVTTFLIENILPTDQQTRCDGMVAQDYIPLAPRSATQFETPLEALDSAANELFYLPEYYYWDGLRPTIVGCQFGGSIEFLPDDEGERFVFTACAFSEGFMMTGHGINHYERGEFTLNVSVRGLASGKLNYVQDSDGNSQVEGIFANQLVDESG